MGEAAAMLKYLCKSLVLTRESLTNVADIYQVKWFERFSRYECKYLLVSRYSPCKQLYRMSASHY